MTMQTISEKRFYGGLLGVILFLASCTSRPDTDDIPNNGSETENPVAALQEAYENGKSVISCEPFEENSDERGGYLLTFSDGTTVSVADTEDGCLTLQIGIDDEGYWHVSYDRGRTYSKICGAAGNPIAANSCRTRVVVDNRGYYVFEFYDPATPATLVETVATPHTTANSGIIRSIVRDEESETMTLSMSDGSVFEFKLDVIRPTGITVSTDKVILGKGTTATIGFAIEPADAYAHFEIAGERANLRLLIAKSSAEPQYYRLTAVERISDENGQAAGGRYRAILRDTAEDRNYDEHAVLVLTTKNESGDSMRLISSAVEISRNTEPELLSVKAGDAEAVKTADDVFEIKLPCGMDLSSVKADIAANGTVTDADGRPVGNGAPLDLSMPATVTITNDASGEGNGRNFKIVAHFSELPVIYLSSPAPVDSKEIWVAGCDMQIWNAGAYNAEYPNTHLKGRGNSTWYEPPKKPYAIKLDKKAEVLGMPKHKRWVLLANYMDYTHLRTETAFYMGRSSRLDYTPRIRYVEVVLNGKYQGLYQITEQLKVDANRVDIAPDGFLLEIDVLDPEGEVFFRIPSIEEYAHINIKAPDVLTDSPEFVYVRDFLTEFDRLLAGDDFADPQTGYLKYIDLDSFVDWYLINEITKNQDSDFYSSCYMHFDREDKIKMGPLWDFDRSLGNYHYAPDESLYRYDGWLTRNASWYSRLFEDARFRAQVKERFRYFYANLPEIERYVSEQDELIREAKANDSFWHDPDDPIDSKFICEWLEKRMEWLKTEFERM